MGTSSYSGIHSLIEMQHSKVFGIGLNKTGTKTLRHCLQFLGYRHLSYDFDCLVLFQEKKYDRLFEIIDLHDSFEDWPWPLMYELLDSRYPGSKFILTERTDPETWYESLRKHAERTGPTEFRKRIYGYYMPDENKQAHTEYYKKHNNAVRDYFSSAPSSLLNVCWENGDRWGELCEFLEKPVPDIPFPHLNRSPVN